MRTAATFAVVLVLSASSAAQQPADRRGEVHEEAVVERVIVDAHVTATDGTPIPNLGPADFVVKVDGKRVVLESVDWLPTGTPEVDPRVLAELTSSSERTPTTEIAPGRLIVLFFQTDYEISRLHGLLRMGIQARRFVGTLDPTDRVAVVSYDSHLKLRQDFTADRAKLERAIHAAIRNSEGSVPDPDSHPSFGKRLDTEEMSRCATPERALEMVARALAPIPGGKSLLFFGWGFGTVGGLMGPNASELQAWADAMQRMAEARVNVFTLDIVDADYHTLEGSIRQIADLTGGHYDKTNLFPELVMDRIGRAISGRYVLVFVKPHLPRGDHDIAVTLANGRKGRVFARQYYSDK